MSDQELKEELASILTARIATYYEIESDVHEEGATSPQFPARWSSDVLEQIDEITSLITERDKKRDAYIIGEDELLSSEHVVEVADNGYERIARNELKAEQRKRSKEVR